MRPSCKKQARHSSGEADISTGSRFWMTRCFLLLCFIYNLSLTNIVATKGYLTSCQTITTGDSIMNDLPSMKVNSTTMTAATLSDSFLPISIQAHQNKKWSSSSLSTLPVSCDEVDKGVNGDQNQSSWWRDQDPNRGATYIRRLNTYPYFRISVHALEYDALRWSTIMERGHYYEHFVQARFLQILQETRKSLMLRMQEVSSLPDAQQQQLQTEYVMIDVGANIGYYSLLLASVLEDYNLPMEIISFEPNAANIIRLCESIRVNTFHSYGDPSNEGSMRRASTISIMMNGVAEEPGEMQLLIPDNPGEARLLPTSDTNSTNSTKHISVVTLDQIAEARGWFDADDRSVCIPLLKIDVEGGEWRVVLGGQRLLGSGAVRHVLMEGRRFGRQNVQNALVVLFQTGFRLRHPTLPEEYVPSTVNAKEHLQGFIKWWQDSYPGSKRQKTIDMWWERPQNTDSVVDKQCQLVRGFSKIL